MHIIHQETIDEIRSYLDSLKNEFSTYRFEFDITDGWRSEETYVVEVTGYHKDDYDPDKQTSFLLLKFFIHHEWKQIHISNIFLPTFMKFNGIGKKLIHKMFVVSERERFDLFLVDMVDSFYWRMIKRHAIPCNGCNDAVQVVRQTKLA